MPACPVRASFCVVRACSARRACVMHACVRASSCVVRASCCVVRASRCDALRYVALRAFVETYGNLWELMGTYGIFVRVFFRCKSSLHNVFATQVVFTQRFSAASRLYTTFFRCKSSLHCVFSLQGVFLLRFLRCRAFFCYVFCAVGRFYTKLLRCRVFIHCVFVLCCIFFVTFLCNVAFFHDVFCAVLRFSFMFLMYFLGQAYIFRAKHTFSESHYTPVC